MIAIPAGNPSLWTGPTGNNTYLLPGATPALIDAGVGHADHLAALAAALSGERLSLVLLTHAHKDHASGVPALRARWPDVMVRPEAAPFADGEVIAAGDGTLTALHTPGHAPDHYCFVDPARGDVYCGDLVRAGGTIVIPGSRGGDMRAYLASLRRVRDLGPRRLLPGHGPLIERPGEAIDDYLEHRRQREEQVRTALRRGLATPEEIAGAIYGRLPSVTRPAAADSVLAHLKKLEEEGEAACVDGRWGPVRR